MPTIYIKRPIATPPIIANSMPDSDDRRLLAELTDDELSALPAESSDEPADVCCGLSPLEVELDPVEVAVAMVVCELPPDEVEEPLELEELEDETPDLVPKPK